jgi:hypothetical protein
MTRSLHPDPNNAALMQAGKALVLGGADNKSADHILDFRLHKARHACASAVQSNSGAFNAIEADATTLLLLAQCVP